MEHNTRYMDLYLNAQQDYMVQTETNFCRISRY